MSTVVKVQVLGVGCSKCKTLEEKIRRLAAVHQLNVEVEKVSDLNVIMNYGIMMIPGLVIDGVLKSYGNIPKDDQLLNWMKGTSQ
jgi:small redox-active disulfide protein 2